MSTSSKVKVFKIPLILQVFRAYVGICMYVLTENFQRGLKNTPKNFQERGVLGVLFGFRVVRGIFQGYIC